MDYLQIPRQLTETCTEYQSSLYSAYIDLIKVFHSINHNFINQTTEI